MLPLSTSMDHRPKEELLQDCVTLASVKHCSGETIIVLWTVLVYCFIPAIVISSYRSSRHVKLGNHGDDEVRDEIEFDIPALKRLEY